MAGDTHGSAIYLEFDSVDLSDYVREFDPGTEDDSVESTSAGDTVRTHLKTKEIAAPTASLVLNSTATTVLNKLKRATSGVLVWGLEGNGSGKPRGGITCRVKRGYPDQSITYDDLQMIEVTWEVTSGAWTYDPTSSTF